jgi:hypothetical protein
MRPPPEASYQVWAARGEKTPVVLDADAAPWLDRVLASAPGRVGDTLALVDIWFDLAAPHEDGAPIVVYIGAQKVGMLDKQATERFFTVMQSARARAARPRVNATLAKATHLRPPYLLVFKIPVPDEDRSSIAQHLD